MAKKTKKKNPAVRAAYSLPLDMVKAIEKMAEKEGDSKSGIVQKLLRPLLQK